MQNIKLIALDLDGTTLDENSRLPKHTKKVLELCTARGIYVIAASGRAFTSLPQEVLDIQGLSLAITSNGAAVYDIKTGERIFSCLMEQDKTEGLLELLDGEPETAVEVFWNGQPYAPKEYLEDPVKYGAPERVIPYLRRTRIPADSIREFIWEKRGELDSLDIIASDPGKRKGWLEKLKRLGGLYVTSSVPYRLEVSNEFGGKGAALRWAAEFLGVEKEAVAAFGNAENDMDMLRFAGLSVAVENSPEAVKACADRIAPANTREGVAQVLLELLEGRKL